MTGYIRWIDCSQVPIRPASVAVWHDGLNKKFQPVSSEEISLNPLFRFGGATLLHREFLRLSFFVFLLAYSIDAHAQSWKKYREVNHIFEIEFPGRVQIIPANLDTETKKKIVRAILYIQDGAVFVYTVASQLNKEGVNFDVTASFAAFKCKTIINNTPLTIPNGRGRELRGVDCHDSTMRAEARYYTTGNWFYQVVAMFKTDGGDENAARYFLQSFKTISK